jgi:hydroxyethylthiazole kinase-like sugar kinase family protein
MRTFVARYHRRSTLRGCRLAWAEETYDRVSIAQPLVLSIGTLEPALMRAMHLALRAARQRATPSCLTR